MSWQGKEIAKILQSIISTGVSIGWVWGYAGSLAQGNTLAFCRVHDIGQRTYGGWGLYLRTVQADKANLNDFILFLSFLQYGDYT